MGSRPAPQAGCFAQGAGQVHEEGSDGLTAAPKRSAPTVAGINPPCCCAETLQTMVIWQRSRSGLLEASELRVTATRTHHSSE